MSDEGSQILVPYQLRTVKVAVQATVVTVAGLVVYGLLPSGEIVHRGLYWVTLACAVGGVAFMASLPWTRLFQSRFGLRVMYVWSALDIILITMLIVAAGPRHAEMFFIYALTTLFFAAAAYPRLAQAVLLLFTFALYIAAQPFVPTDVNVAMMMMRLVVLTCTAFMASFLSWELRGQMEAHGHAHHQAMRRTELLKVVAGAGRSMNSLDPDRVWGVVTDSVLALDFEAAGMCLLDEDGDTYRILEPRGLPAEFAENQHSTSTGIIGRVIEKDSLIYIDDYSSFNGAHPMIRELGFTSVIAAPIYTDGKIDAILVGGSRQRLHIDQAVVESFELLASHAGRALENTKRFAEERKALQRFSELDRLKGDFLSNISHELRTPLTAIEGMTLTLLGRWDLLDDAARLEMLQRVNSNARSLEEIVTNLLDFARFESGGFELKTSEVDMSDLAGSVATRLEHLLKDHDFHIELDGYLMVNADPTLIERVIENFLSNAAKHTEKGTKIVLSAGSRRGRLVVSVADNGQGIPPEDLPHIGDRFFRGGDADTRATRGVGLGIAFAKQIIEMHGGTFEVRSELNKGSEFRFTLPLVERRSRKQRAVRAAV